MSKAKYRIVLHREAVAEIQKLPAGVKKQTKALIDDLAHTPTPIGAIKLKGRVNAYRIRMGVYRLIYEIHATEIVIYVVGVAHRKEVYQRLLRRK